MGDDMSAYKDVFLSESGEYIQSITDGLLALERDPEDLEPVETVFRGAHSLKGMAAAMGYERTAELTHKMESLMDTVHKREQPVDSSLIDLMLRAVDTVRELVDDESSGGTRVEAGAIVADIVERTESAGAEKPAGEVGAVAGGTRDTDQTLAGGGSVERCASLLRVSVTLEEACVLKSVRAYMAIKRLGHMGTVVETVPAARQIEDEEFELTFEVIVRTKEPPEAVINAVSAISEIHAVDVEVIEAQVEDVDVVFETEGASEASARRREVTKLAETQTVRISIGHLDNMVNLVGELVIIRSRLERLAHDVRSADMLEAIEGLRQVSSELQHEVMQTRMVPVGNIFNRFPRMVRDLAQELDKKIAFEMDGLDIELDRTVLDEIVDPIVHLLRNAVDHGIEPAAERAQSGKPESGRVELSAVREREQVRITVTDDGRGIDLDRVWAKACERGLVQQAYRDSYTAQEILLLTCAPGFSTAEKATKVSGRGVGMDVVKGKIEYLGGSLLIDTKPGGGTEFALILPLTLAIVPALMVGVGGQVYSLPLSAVNEVLSIDEVKIDTVDASPVVVLRDGDVAPLFRLDALLGKHGQLKDMPSTEDHVVLLQVASDIKALAVEHLLGRMEIVVKPLSPLFKGLRGVGGATVLGDGRVAITLDPRSLFQLGGEHS